MTKTANKPIVNVTRCVRNEVLYLRGIFFRGLGVILLCVLILTGCLGQRQKAVSIEIWHYYTGAQKIKFDNLVAAFNQTEGMEKGVIVEAFSQGDKKTLQEKLKNTINDQGTTNELPNIIVASADMVEELDDMQVVVDLEAYIKKSEINAYDDSYIHEHYIGKDQKFKLVPIAKSTEVLMVNKTDWEKFAYDVGAHIKDLETWEGLARVAQKYYDWTNNQSSKPDDGKAFFASDSLASYVLGGSKQLGQDILVIEGNHGRVHIDHAIMQKLWDNYYIPYLNGHYGPFERFSSDDLKTGKIIAYVGPIEEVTYFPKEVTVDGHKHDIECMVLPLPNFANSEPWAVLQGVGMAVINAKEPREKAAVDFIRWFTRSTNNLSFSLATGYLPAAKNLRKTEAIEAKLKESKDQIPVEVSRVLPVAAQQIETYNVHVQDSFNRSIAAREVLGASLINRAKGDKAKVADLVSQGISKRQAIDLVATETNFQQWIVRFKMEAQGVMRIKLQ